MFIVDLVRKLPIVKVTRNRQITIPSEISKIVGIREGDFVEITVRGDEIIVKKVKSLEELAGSWKDIDENELSKIIKARWKTWFGSV